MTLAAKKYNLNHKIMDELQKCRQQTLTMLTNVNPEAFKLQAHRDFSPVGWHFGHIAYVESLWLLKRCGHRDAIFPENTRLYAADGLPKSERVNLPSIEQTRDLLDSVRERVIKCLNNQDISEELLQFLLQHESQHGETILLVLKLLEKNHNCCAILPNGRNSVNTSARELKSELVDGDTMLKIPAGEFIMGSNDVRSLDNEKGEHQVYLDTYYIDAYPVTRGQFRQFMEAGGYENRELWSDLGWKWLQSERVNQPLYWCDCVAEDNHPVCGVSWYEAETFAKFVGKRLPTEAEWEKAARWDAESKISYTYPWGEAAPSRKYCNFNLAGLGGDENTLLHGTSPVNAHPDGKSPYGMYDALGNVWEWTASWFTPYPQFRPYPYPGYSQAYFDNKHRVLKGSSFATRQWSLRASFRNWYYPSVRQIFAGFRCAKSDDC